MRRKPVLFCVILLVFAGCTAAPNSELQGSTALTYSAAAGGSGAPVTPYGDTLNATTDGNTVRLAAVLGRHDPRGETVVIGGMDQTLPANWSITVENTRPTYRGDNPAQPVAANAVSVRGDASWNGTIAEGERQHLTAEITFHTPGIYRVTANGVILAWEDTPGFCCGTTHTFQVLYNGTTLFLSRGAGFCHQDHRLHPDTFRCEQRNSTTADAENTPY